MQLINRHSNPDLKHWTVTAVCLWARLRLVKNKSNGTSRGFEAASRKHEAFIVPVEFECAIESFPFQETCLGVWLRIGTHRNFTLTHFLGDPHQSRELETVVARSRILRTYFVCEPDCGWWKTSPTVLPEGLKHHLENMKDLLSQLSLNVQLRVFHSRRLAWEYDWG